VAAVASIAALAVTVYYSLRIDWAKLIGRWAPWALEENGKKDGDKTDP
jgi:hypothetical protein